MDCGATGVSIGCRSAPDGPPSHPTGKAPYISSVLHVTPGRRQPLVASETPKEPPGHSRERVRVGAPLEGRSKHALRRLRRMSRREIRGCSGGDGTCALEASEAPEVVEHRAIVGQGARPDSVTGLFQQLPHLTDRALPESLVGLVEHATGSGEPSSGAAFHVGKRSPSTVFVNQQIQQFSEAERPVPAHQRPRGVGAGGCADQSPRMAVRRRPVTHDVMHQGRRIVLSREKQGVR